MDQLREIRKKQINVIVEVHAKTGFIDYGKELKPDLKYFRERTSEGEKFSNALIMGRKTYETINRPLPTRHNYIISRTIDHIEGCQVFKSLDVALIRALQDPQIKTIWICGGKQIYLEFAGKYLANNIYLVLNHQPYYGLGECRVKEEDIVDGRNYDISEVQENNQNYSYYHYKLEVYKNKNKEEYAYKRLVSSIIENGFYQLDRTGVGTFVQHGAQLRFNLRDKTFPAITSRRVFIRGAIEEFLWMLRGETDITKLQENDIHIWDGNTTEEFIKNRGLKGIVPTNNIGALYGYQMRNWGGDWEVWLKEGKKTGIDQLEKLINSLKTDPNSRRHIISNYNVSQLDMGVLEPCHTLYCFTVDEDKKELHSTLFMRSTDTCCGLVLNILHIAFLTHILANVMSTEHKKYTAGDFVFMGNNVHIYTNHIAEFILQEKRKTYRFPKIQFNKQLTSLKDIETLEYKDVSILDYKQSGVLKYEMAI